HAEEQVELRVLLDGRLPEDRRPRRIEADREPVEDHLGGVLVERGGRRPVGGERVPVRDEGEAALRLLQAEPVLQRTLVVPEVLAPGRPRAADDRFSHRYVASRRKKSITGCTSRDTRLPCITTRKSTINAIRSTGTSARATRTGRSAVSTRPPSSGGT